MLAPNDDNKMAPGGAIAALEWIRANGATDGCISSRLRVSGQRDARVAQGLEGAWLAPQDRRARERRPVAETRQVDARIPWSGLVRGHNEHVKNEYANALAIRAADQQERSNA